jgi:hypothetical protein
MIRLYLQMFGEARRGHVNHVFGVVIAENPSFAPEALHDALASNLHPAVFMLAAYAYGGMEDAHSFRVARSTEVSAMLEIADDHEQTFIRRLAEDAELDRWITGRAIVFVLSDRRLLGRSSTFNSVNVHIFL